MIPDGWKIELLGEFMLVRDGVHQTPTYTESGVPFLRVTDIQDESINLSKTKYISKEEHDKITARLKPTNGDILYSKNGTIGITRIVDWDWEFSFFVSLALLRFKKDGYSVEYIAQYLQSDLAKREIYQGSKQGSVINLHLEEIQKFRVPIPPFLEQCKIAEVLGVWDESIDLLEKLIGKTRSRKQGLMQQLLTGKKRFKEFEGREWKEGLVSDLIKSLDAGVSVNSEDRCIEENELGILKTSAVTYGIFAPDEHKVILSEEVARATISPRKDRIIISRMNTPNLVGASVYIGKDYPSLFLPDRLWQAEPKSNNFSMRWLSYVLASDIYREKISNLATGTSNSMKNIAKSSILKMSMMIPSLPEQEKIAAVLSAADEEISTLEKQLAAYKQQKLGLMQQLLTGKIRVGTI